MLRTRSKSRLLFAFTLGGIPVALERLFVKAMPEMEHGPSIWA
jgi:hypothetical protein